MSKTIVPSWNAQPIRAVVLGDVLDLTPEDARFSYTYAATTKPGGSASFTGAKITPDVVGAYVFTVTVGADVLTLSAFVFSTANSAALATDLQGATRSDAVRRQLLQGLANTVPASVLVTWAGGGVFPPGVNLAQFGG